MIEAETEEKKSTHKCEVVPVVLEKHPQADRLSIAKVFGFTCVTETTQWNDNKLAVYIPPDSVVKCTRPEFSFLLPQAKVDGTYRIKAKKLRGVLSFGLLVPAPEGAKEGDDLAELLEVEHYVPKIDRQSSGTGRLFASGEVSKAPDVYVVKYDLESGRRYAATCFTEGEPVIVTEKIHGCNARYVFHDGQMYCGSRTEWKKEYPDYSHITVDLLKQELVKKLTPEEAETRAKEILTKLQNKKGKKNLWWQTLDATPALKIFCKCNPGCIVYGEVYGAVQDLNYGKKPGEVAFAAFDVMLNGAWINYSAAKAMADVCGLEWVPVLAEMPYNFNKICEMAEGQTTVKGADHVREGVVVRPVKERTNHNGRVCLKWVGAGYLEKSKGD